MPKDFLYWSKWSPHLSNAISIATAIPIIVGAISGIYAYLNNIGSITIAIYVLVGFTMTLWSCIGLIWLKDRSKPRMPVKTMLIRDCAWGLDITSVAMHYVPEIMIDDLHEWSFSFFFKNHLSWPVRISIEEARIIINHMTPIVELESGFIIQANSNALLYMGYFKRNQFAFTNRINGELYIKAIYGHPEDGYSRVMVKKFELHGVITTDRPSKATSYSLARKNPIETDTPILEMPARTVF